MVINSFYESGLESEQQSSSIKILVVDDQHVIRAKIQEILSTYKNFEIVGMAGDGNKAIALIQDLKPDVVLMDIEMPKMNGIEVTKIIARKFPETKTLVLSTHEEEEYVQKIISAGADGYILKQTPPLEFILAIHAVHKGYSHFGPNIMQKMRVVGEDKALSQNKHTNSQNESNTLDSEPPDESPGLALTKEAPSLDKVSTNLPRAEVEDFLPPVGKWLSWGAMMVLATILTLIPLSSILKYKTKVKAPAIVRPQGEVRLVQAQTEGLISEIFLKPGDKVAQGDLIARINPYRFLTQKKQLEQAIAQQELQLAQLKSQTLSLENQIDAEQKRNEAEIIAAESNLTSEVRAFEEKSVEVGSQLQEAQANLRSAEATLKAAESRSFRYRDAVEAGALSKEQFAETELEVKQQRQAVKAAQARLRFVEATLDPIDMSVGIARQNIQQAKKSGKAAIAGLNREREATIQQQSAINQQLEGNQEDLKQIEQDLERTFIRATASGEISQLELRNPGQTVQPGQEIAQIVPDEAALEIRLLASSQEISKLKIGQKMQMRVSACPYPDYGVLNGRVSRIANDIRQLRPGANSNSANGASSGPIEPGVYEIFVKPEAQSFGSKEYQCQLQIGMDGAAEIITREETVLRFVLRKARLISNV